MALGTIRNDKCLGKTWIFLLIILIPILYRYVDYETGTEPDINNV
jgi:hypothetical protein